MIRAAGLPTTAPGRQRCRPLAARIPTLVLLIAWSAAAVRGQDEAGPTTWVKLEAAKETADYKEKLRGGGGIDAKARQFLEQTALPQLALEANRATITTVRKRLREFLLNDIADEKVADEANRVFTGFLTALAAKEDEQPLVRVNALLLVGELQTAGSAGRKPWPGAIVPLAKAAADATLPKELRIAALAGLSRHFEISKAGPEAAARLSKDAGPQLVSIVKELVGGDGGPEDNWLLSRSLSMLAMLGPAGPEPVAAVTKTLQSPRLSFDTRVRSATALSAMSGPQSNVADPAALIKSIEDLAIASLQHDADVAERLKLEKLLGGDGGLLIGMSGGMAGGSMPAEAMGPPPGAGPGFGSPSDLGSPSGMGFPAQPPAEHLIPTEVCRRAAWRLSSLANAILTADEKRGLRTLIQDEEAAAKAKGLAQNLRSLANTLDTAPVDASLLQALADLKPEPPPTPDGEAAPADDADAAAESPAPAAGGAPAPAKPAVAPGA